MRYNNWNKRRAKSASEKKKWLKKSDAIRYYQRRLTNTSYLQQETGEIRIEQYCNYECSKMIHIKQHL